MVGHAVQRAGARDDEPIASVENDPCATLAAEFAVMHKTVL